MKAKEYFKSKHRHTFFTIYVAGVILGFGITQNWLVTLISVLISLYLIRKHIGGVDETKE